MIIRQLFFPNENIFKNRIIQTSTEKAFITLGMDIICYTDARLCPNDLHIYYYVVNGSQRQKTELKILLCSKFHTKNVTLLTY